MAEDPNETSGGDAGTPPPSEASTPGGHTDLNPITPGGETEPGEGGTVAGPSVAATPGGHTDVGPITPGGETEPGGGNTAVAPTVAASVGSSPGGAGGLAGDALGDGEGTTDTVLPTEAANVTPTAAGVAEDEEGKAPEEASGGRTGALPNVAATPSPSSFGPGGT